MPDDKKRNTDQLDYRITGLSNDELRQQWMDSIVPHCEEIGIDVPAHYNNESDEYELEYDLPVAFVEDEKNWRFDEHISWSDVMDRS